MIFHFDDHIFVGDEAVNAEDHIAICGEEELAYRGSKAGYAQREREKERGTKNNSIKNAIVTSNNNNNLYKRLQSHFI